MSISNENGPSAGPRTSFGLVTSIGIFSFFVNLLVLTGPLFMLQVYDRVLGSGSVPTLTALFVLMTFLYLMMWVIDIARNRIAVRMADGFQARLEGAAFRATLLARPDSPARGAVQDVDSVQKLIASPVFLAVFDLPFAPLFMAAVFILHPVLGWISLGGAAFLILLTALNHVLVRRPMRRSAASTMEAERAADGYGDGGETVAALGMRATAFARWRRAREQAAEAGMAGSDIAGLFTVSSRTSRLYLQSALLAAGALLVLRQEITPGAMIAASILMGRALAPVEQVVGGWTAVQRARDGWGRLKRTFAKEGQQRPKTPLPRPEARLDVSGLVVIPPGSQEPTLRGVSFSLSPGQALGVIGQSGSGKSTLARALVGVWPAAAGTIRLDGATIDQRDPDVLGRLIGHLPQNVLLFDGTITDNIARLDPSPDPEEVVKAAKAANAHEMILDLPAGYDTSVARTGGRLSGGQVQRIGLARALYGDPALFILDEPNSNLDNEGSAALNAAVRGIKERGGAVIIMTHRPAAITECDLLLIMEKGAVRAFGPRDEVLRAMVSNSGAIRMSDGAGSGVA